MSDHGSGPRAFADPVVDITDMYVFPSPQRPGTLVLVMNVFPSAGPTAFFSDAVDYRFRLRPVQIESSGPAAAFVVGDTEHRVTCRFATPAATKSGGPLAQKGTCTTSYGPSVSFLVNDAAGGETKGLKAFAGRRMDPFFFDGPRAGKTIATGKLSFEAVGLATTAHQNILSVIVEVDAASLTAQAQGPLLGVVSETVTQGGISARLERFGRPEIKNLLLMPMNHDTVNRAIELRDLYNQDDAFNLGKAYAGAYRSRLNGNLAFWDGLDGKTDWPLAANGTHPLTELLLADFMVVDVSKPFSEASTLEIEQAMLKGTPHQTCGGRPLNDDCMETFLTLLVNASKGPRISDGVDAAPTPAADSFPYLLPPEPNPPQVTLPPLNPAK
ncbi:MAG TPA: DUF4331 family protein [Steroidobacteraceae bacterium]|nr:DUF4331 family protein [Steroidobacteraceae bacterium]